MWPSRAPVEPGGTGRWLSREDDVHFGYYNAVAAMYMKAAIGADGKPTAWLQRSAFPPITSLLTGGESSMSSRLPRAAIGLVLLGGAGPPAPDRLPG